MVTIAATHSATQTVQSSLGKARVEQARRDADQAEANARDLRAQADEAELQAQRSHDNFRRLSSAAQQQEVTYKRPQRSSTPETPQKIQNLIEQMYSAVSSKYSKNGNSLKAVDLSTPIVNAQGQSTGRIVNISA
ncbi:MAG: hypothetical protein RIR09_1619 [Pseudomonadota bacterium]|jgi:uncharacterized protein YigA (DUF484 family)